jgi:hypothetical protein
MEGLERYQALRRRGAILLGTGAVLVVANVAFLADQLPYFTSAARPVAYAIYALGALLIALGGHALWQASVVKATLT